MKTVVALPGEGIGVEAVDATCDLMAAADMPVKILTPPHGLRDPRRAGYSPVRLDRR